MPKVSVIIPVYNVEKYLQINYVLLQNLFFKKQFLMKVNKCL